MGLLLLVALSMPFIFYYAPGENDNGIRTLSLRYEYTVAIQSGGGWVTDTSRVDTLEFYVTLRNMNAVLQLERYDTIPLAVDSTNWDIDQQVRIGSYDANVIVSDVVRGHTCWICDIELTNTSQIGFDVDSGILVFVDWFEMDRIKWIELLDMTFDPEPIPYIREEGVLLTAIFIELAVIIWQVADRRKRSL